ncbi:MAG: alpha/beta hydrolase [Deltaproteobacteria bacterium]|nr:alpha/beta hydrolase [Deltaproteobacteria bacterium]
MPSHDLIPCIPPSWARSGHAQTIMGHLLPSPAFAASGKQLTIPLTGGDSLVAVYHEGAGNTVVYVFHGLSGDTDASYMGRTAAVCARLGYSVFLVNHRGAGLGYGLAHEPYHSGRAEDLSAALQFGRKLHPRKKHVAIGFSLSGNALLLLLSGRRGTTKPNAAIAVNAPIALEKTSLALKTGLNRIYDLRFVHDCRAQIANPAARKRVPRLATIRDFDALYTAPASGFRDRDHYYATCSTLGVLNEIQTPTVLLTAKDDPFIDYRDYLMAPLSPSVHLHVEESGGHMGYLSALKTPLGTRRWLDYALWHFLTRI